ncbi:MAG TPA: DUF6677 family protein, partial [Blastocatellia bacterium]|nr:DUF6677 family protein [Blastocatellia bacterium]
HFSDRRLPSNVPQKASIAMRIASLVASWLVPGAGHLMLGKAGRAALFFVVIVGAFALGLALHGRLFWPTADPSSTFRFDLITVLWFAAQIGSGLCYLVSYGLGLGSDPPVPATSDYGNTFMLLAGLLNFLVIYDAFDIAAGRKR